MSESNVSSTFCPERPSSGARLARAGMTISSLPLVLNVYR